MPRLPPNGVAQSKPKKAFFAALELAEGDGHSTKVYRQMQGEARAARDQLATTPSGLAPSRYPREVKMPYSWDDIMETAKHRAVLAVYRNASPVTKPYYQHAHYLDGKNEENWAIQWCLWHSFRMFRNGSGARMPKVRLEMSQFDAVDGGTPSSGGFSGTSEGYVGPSVQPETPTSWAKFDHSVVNERYTGSSMPDSPSWQSTGTPNESISSTPPRTREVYWDPVRDA